jgi:hypothetical protein
MTLNQCDSICEGIKLLNHYLAEEYEQILAELDDHDVTIDEDIDLTETCNYIINSQEELNKKIKDLGARK